MSGNNELATVETMSFLERATRDPSLDVAKIEQLIALQERLLDREAKRQFAEAMNALQTDMPQVSRDRTNPHTRSRYATYESIDAVLRPHYTQHGFSVQFTTHAKDGRVRVGCTVSHVGGHSESKHELESSPDVAGARGTANKSEVQGVGSIVSYLKRYTIMAAFAVAVQDDETDDDGDATKMPAQESRRDQLTRETQKLPPADPLAEKDGFKWLRNFEQALANAQSQQEVVDINEHPSVELNTATAPADAKRRIAELQAHHYARFAEPEAEQAKDDGWPGPDPEEMKRQREAAAVA